MPSVLAGGQTDVLVREELLANLARPGGTATGLVISTGPGLSDKRLPLLKEAVPKASRVAYLGEPAFQPPLRPPAP